MALNTQAPFRAALEKMLVHGPGVGFVTGHAVHRNAVPGVRSFIALGMGKFLMLLVAARADLFRRFLDHPRPVGTMQIVAIGTFVPTGMLVQHLGPATERPFVAGAATGPLVGRQ